MICTKCKRGKLWAIRLLPKFMVFQCDVCDAQGLLPREAKMDAENVRYVMDAEEVEQLPKFVWRQEDVTVREAAEYDNDVRNSQHPI